MRGDVLHHTGACAALLADAVADLAAELRLLDLADMAVHIRGGQWAAIADLVRTAAELSFRDGTLLFACVAAIDLDWAQPPAMSLDMELQTAAVTAFFTLDLAREGSAVELKKLWFAQEPTDAAAATRLFAGALADARLDRVTR